MSRCVVVQNRVTRQPALKLTIYVKKNEINIGEKYLNQMNNYRFDHLTADRCLVF